MTLAFDTRQVACLQALRERVKTYPLCDSHTPILRIRRSSMCGTQNDPTEATKSQGPPHTPRVIVEHRRDRDAERHDEGDVDKQPRPIYLRQFSNALRPPHGDREREAKR